MYQDIESIDQQIASKEALMYAPDFWNDKETAKRILKELEALKTLKATGHKEGGLPALLTIFAGVGGDDAEDFVAMLFRMYQVYAENRGWTLSIVSSSPNDAGGYRSIACELQGKAVYGTLRHEAGVHRLVRISPFNAQDKRQTSFAMVEVVPITQEGEHALVMRDVRIDFTRSGGPGGQNVNKRETAVRVVHEPTGISVLAQTERSQEANREKALALLSAKVRDKEQKDRDKEARGYAISKTVEIEWGNQMRSYVLHPYKMVKDHVTGVEVADVTKVLERGELDVFIDAYKKEE